MLIFLGLFFLIYDLYNRQKKYKEEKEKSEEFSRLILEKSEKERKRIANDLHDSVNQELLEIKIGLYENHSPLIPKIDAIINNIRLISRNLHPVMFEKVGLKLSLEQLIERTQELENFSISSTIEYKDSLTVTDELQIYRIVQESITNSIKYSNAFAAGISIHEIGNELILEIKDNGKGFNVQQTLEGYEAFGLHSILERAKSMGGKATIESSAKGTIIHVRIPLKK